jgi:putative membrane protein
MFSGTWCGGMGLGGWVLMVAFWTAFIALSVWAITRIFPARPSTGAFGPDGPAPFELLDQRLAAGEIDVETYQRLRRELNQTSDDRSPTRGR